MIFKFFLYTSLFLFILRVQTKIELLSDQLNLQESTGQQISLTDFQYAQTVEVARRHLQVVSLSSKETSKSIENSNYSGLIVYHNFPSTFVIGQIFQVRGKINIPQINCNTLVTFCFINKVNILLKYVYSVAIPAGNSDFFINVDTRSVPAGEYYIGLYPGTKMCYDPKITYVLKTLVTENNNIPAPSTPTGCLLDLVNEMLVVKWKEDTSISIKRIAFTQNDKSVEYLLSNFVSSFQVIYRDFAGFTNGTVSVSIQSAFSASNGLSDRTSAYSSAWTYTFVAGPHNFIYISPSITLTKDIPWRTPVGTNITVQGTAKVSIKNELKIQESSQFSIQTYKLSVTESDSIPSGSKFSKTVYLLKSGTYILEIKGTNGECLLNRPIYVGTFLPLIPDYSDLAPVMDSSTIHLMLEGQPKTVDEVRQMLLHHVNEKRASWGRGPLIMKENLNSLAQSHSNDMVANNYLSNVNKQGLSPQDRANKAGLNCSVEQLVATNLDLIQAHNIMCRTPSDLEIIMKENCTQIGLGVARNAQGYMYITQVFGGLMQKTSVSSAVSIVPSDSGMVMMSESPTNGLTCAQTQALKNEVRDWMLAKYPSTKEDPILSAIICQWLCTKNGDTIFDYTWNTAKYPANYLSGTYVVAPYSTTFTSGFNEGLFLKRPDASYAKFGIGVMQQPNGKVKVYVEYAK